MRKLIGGVLIGLAGLLSTAAALYVGYLGVEKVIEGAWGDGFIYIVLGVPTAGGIAFLPGLLGLMLWTEA